MRNIVTLLLFFVLLQSCSLNKFVIRQTGALLDYGVVSLYAETDLVIAEQALASFGPTNVTRPRIESAAVSSRAPRRLQPEEPKYSQATRGGSADVAVVTDSSYTGGSTCTYSATGRFGKGLSNIT